PARRLGRRGGAARGGADRRLLPEPGRPGDARQRERRRRHAQLQEPGERRPAAGVPLGRRGPAAVRRGQPRVPGQAGHPLVRGAAGVGRVPGGLAGPLPSRRAERRRGTDRRSSGMEIVSRRIWLPDVRSLSWGWTSAALLLVALLSIPLLVVAVGALRPAGE